MIKKYKLLKDTPESKAGTVFENRGIQEFKIDGGIRYVPEGYYPDNFVFTGQTCSEYFTSEIIESKHEWFREIPSFKTEDGEIFFEGDKAYSISLDNKVFTIAYPFYKSDDTLLFKSFDKATEYVKNLKSNFKKITPTTVFAAGVLSVKDNKIQSAQRFSDGKVFNVGNLVRFNDSKMIGIGWRIDQLFIRSTDQVLMAASKDREMVEVIDSNLELFETTEQLASVLSEDIEKRYKETLSHIGLVGLSISKKDLDQLEKNLSAGPNIGRGQCVFDYGKGKQEETKVAVKTHDGHVSTNGDIIYGISLKALGSDQWRTQVLPFTHHIGENRIWFANKEKANEYLIYNKPCLSISDLRNKNITLPNVSFNRLIELVKERI